MELKLTLGKSSLFTIAEKVMPFITKAQRIGKGMKRITYFNGVQVQDILLTKDSYKKAYKLHSQLAEA